MKIQRVSVIIGIILMVTLQAFAQKSPVKNKVEIKGKLKNFPASVVLENFSDIQHMVPGSFNPVSTQKKDSSFSITITLSEPTYFRFGRNKLYLSPGDNLYAVMDNNNSNLAIFTGKGSEANNYLRSTPFPKGGSFLEAGKNIKQTPKEMLQYILEAAKQRQKELEALKGVSAEFVRLEKARIKADVVKSIESTRSYSQNKFTKETNEFQQAYINEFNTLAKPVKDSLLTNFYDPSFLQLEVYRDIIYSLTPDANANPKTIQAFKDYQKAHLLGYVKIKPLNDKTKLAPYKASVDSIQTLKYRNALNLLIKDKMKFGNGDPAVDFTVRNTDGTTTTLSSLKGKLIYIDIWATWCGPCMAELPNLEKLKEKYKDHPGIAIVSLSVDDNDPIWLKNLNSREAKGIQWRIDRAKLRAYELLSIPRYILIDQTFKVVDIVAGMPSDEALQKKLEELLKSSK